MPFTFYVGYPIYIEFLMCLKYMITRTNQEITYTIFTDGLKSILCILW